MAFTPLKHIYDNNFYELFFSDLKKIIPKLDITHYTNLIYNDNWEQRELKDRMKQTTAILNEILSKDFTIACTQIKQAVAIIDLKQFKYGSLAFMFFPDYIATYGLDHFELSMKTLKDITHFTSSEFAVRPFIIQNQTKALALMEKWSLDENFHIRRLASEGCRPKLPWAVALKELQKDASSILPILHNLKNDPEDYVYRSVANNLNDISKDHPKLVLDIANHWKGYSKNTDWLVKHSLRTLLKKGDQTAMKLFGYGDAKNIHTSSFYLLDKEVAIGAYLNFEFYLHNKVKAVNRLEYAIFFLIKNGKWSKKVFKISEKEYAKDSETFISKRHSFKLISTRTYYKGIHKVSLIVNGIEKDIQEFKLV
ncbi:MAG: 3-methyladenine DNA glycosylase AlkC [Planctomycetota bacterium]|jgi:3-methyladenine DNA glycosylase AlkC